MGGGLRNDVRYMDSRDEFEEYSKGDGCGISQELGVSFRDLGSKILLGVGPLWPRA